MNLWDSWSRHFTDWKQFYHPTNSLGEPKAQDMYVLVTCETELDKTKDGQT